MEELREDYGSSTVALPPNKNEGNLKEENNPHDPPSGSGRRCDDHAKPLLLWEKINGRPITEFEGARIIDLSNTYGEEWLADAMKVAGDSSKRKLNYVEGILNRWQTDGKDSVKGKRCSHFPDDGFPG